ncbi:MAG: hypothetical protein JNL71_17195 [Rhodospirillales bacterium]|nr:hypothetical protein [Rhodospirillales bacterium]
MTADELLAAYDATLARLAADTPEPGPARRLIDPLLRLFGADSRTHAVRERTRLLDRAARQAVAAGDPMRAGLLDEALRSRVSGLARPAS